MLFLILWLLPNSMNLLSSKSSLNQSAYDMLLYHLHLLTAIFIKAVFCMAFHKLLCPALSVAVNSLLVTIFTFGGKKSAAYNVHFLFKKIHWRMPWHIIIGLISSTYCISSFPTSFWYFFTLWMIILYTTQKTMQLSPECWFVYVTRSFLTFVKVVGFLDFQIKSKRSQWLPIELAQVSTVTWCLVAL